MDISPEQFERVKQVIADAVASAFVASRGGDFYPFGEMVIKVKHGIPVEICFGSTIKPAVTKVKAD